MSASSKFNRFSLPQIPSRSIQGLLEGILCALYVAGGTSIRDFLQLLGITGYKCGLTSRRYVDQRIIDLRARKYASITAPAKNRSATISTHPLGFEWFKSPLPDPALDPVTQKLLARIPSGAFEDGVILFRLPPGRQLAEVEKSFQSLLAPRALNNFLMTPDGVRRLNEAGLPADARLFTDYDLVGDVRRSLTSELFLVRPQRELHVLLEALIEALQVEDKAS